ncbi:hypothetical protein CDD80_2884 [Ophiocordyceps camponoti-rufipedis]|uniref:CSC1/OSCA1-like 7TM region domain-containing protein n=1 Tax=Ophiocordyceps camponoti-rufipedis TaxID=2004952 RepID=A0A2C5Z5T1_9HYPO|nr:hypothetical protein CDD80_2884 [Ophiocordyceps camponoti-rufipedis]
MVEAIDRAEGEGAALKTGEIPGTEGLNGAASGPEPGPGRAVEEGGPPGVDVRGGAAKVAAVLESAAASNGDDAASPKAASPRAITTPPTAPPAAEPASNQEAKPTAPESSSDPEAAPAPTGEKRKPSPEPADGNGPELKRAKTGDGEDGPVAAHNGGARKVGRPRKNSKREQRIEDMTHHKHKFKKLLFLPSQPISPFKHHPSNLFTTLATMKTLTILAISAVAHAGVLVPQCPEKTDAVNCRRICSSADPGAFHSDKVTCTHVKDDGRDAIRCLSNDRFEFDVKVPCKGKEKAPEKAPGVAGRTKKIEDPAAVPAQSTSTGPANNPSQVPDTTKKDKNTAADAGKGTPNNPVQVPPGCVPISSEQVPSNADESSSRGKEAQESKTNSNLAGRWAWPSLVRPPWPRLEAAMDLPMLSARDDSPNDASKQLLDLLQNPFRGQIAAVSLPLAFGISLGTLIFTAICFSFIRPYHQAIYAPKLKHADKKYAPPPLGKKPWAWITPVLQTTEASLVPQIGMDATIFLRFTRMCRNMFLVLALVGFAILVPVNVANSTVYEGHISDWTMRITPRDVWGQPQWAQVVVAWLFDLIIIGFLWYNYRSVLRLRRRYFETDEYQNSLHSRTLMLYDLPRQARSDEGIARIIDKVVPNSSFARTVVARNVKILPELIDEHEHAVRKLEKILAKYLKNPAQLPASRPTCKPSKKDRSLDTYPRGQKLDAIDYYTQRIRDLEIEIKEVRASVDRRGTMPYGFASYSDMAEAHAIAHACRGSKPEGATVMLAPKPSDIIWQNMPLSKATRSRRRWINNFWIVVLTFLWVAPNAMMAIFLVNLSNLGKVWPAFQRNFERNIQFWGMVQGIASPALTSLVYLVLPIIFRRLSVQAGDQTKTGRESHVLARMYSFFVFNNLIVFSCFSTIWAFVAGVKKRTNSGTNAWEAIEKENMAAAVFLALCENSLFWVTYLLQRELGIAVDLAQLWPLIQGFFLKKLSSPTPRELIELTAPPAFDYASYYNYFLFYVTVTLCFASIQPLVLPATALFFCFEVYLKKYLILYRFVTKTESGGLFWRVLFNRFILATILANLVVLLTCWVRGDGTHIQFYAVAPLPLVMMAFKLYCRRAFDDKIRYYSTRLSSKLHDAQLHKEPRLRSEKLSTKFGHPALYRPLITPMVHSKAQNLLPSVYRGRLTDGRGAGGASAGGDDLVSVSGYSDMYALDAMQQGGKPGQRDKGRLPGFEYVSESHMDFAYYKDRAEFTEQHGGSELYGRPGTPGTDAETQSLSGRSFSATTVTRTRSPLYGENSGSPLYRQETGGGSPLYPRQDHGGSPLYRQDHGGSPLYSHDNGSSAGLVRNAAAAPTGPPPLGSFGYSGLAQAEESDPGRTSYFRGGSRPLRPAGEGW